ncbi:unnamed protein product [Brassica oleracea var. botrytis]
MISAHASGKSQVALIGMCPLATFSCFLPSVSTLSPFDPTKKKKMKVVILDPIEDSTESQAEKTDSSPRVYFTRCFQMKFGRSSRNFSIYLTKGSHSPSLRQWFGRILHLILKELSPRAESRPELEFLNSNMIFANLARLRLM